MAVRVLASGFYTSIQDRGRFGYRAYGVPLSGAMDQFSAELANRLVGNDPGCAVLESTLKGPVLEFTEPTRIAMAGATFETFLNDTPIMPLTEIPINRGDRLRFGPLKTGVRCYLAVLGGFQTEQVMGSRSQYIGITTAWQIKKGDILPFLKQETIATKKHASFRIRTYGPSIKALVVSKGAEFDKLSKAMQKELFKVRFGIRPQSNRMAYLVESEEIFTAPEILTAPVQPGTVQLTPSGKLVILMRDAQTTGGYARILQLTEHAINQLAQVKAGDCIRFERV